MENKKLTSKFTVTRLRVGMAQIGLVLVALFVVAKFNYLLFHILAEFFGAAISLAIFFLAWNTRKFAKNNYYLFFGMAFLTYGAISLIHALTYRGMGVVAGTANDSNVATQLWLASQYTLAATFIVAPFLLGKKIKTPSVILGYLAAFAFFLTAIFYWKIFPAAYVEGIGLTPFKKISEYIVAAFFLLSLYFFWRRRNLMEKRFFRLISFTLALFFLSTVFFTLYVGVYSFPNEFGHLLRVLAFYVSYLALVELGLMKPYHSIFKDLKDKESELKKAIGEWDMTFNSISDPIFILDTSHTIVKANQALLEFLGKSEDEVVGKKCYELVHKQHQPWMNCPLVATKKTGKSHTEEVIDPGLGKALLITTSPILNSEGKIIGIAHVAKDITERKKMEEKMEDLAKFPLENPNPVVRVSSEGIILYANPAAGVILKTFRLVVGQSFSGEWKDRIISALKKNEKQLFETTLEKNIYSVEIAPISEGNYVNLYARDVTGQRKAELNLLYEKEKFSRILDNMEDSVYMVTKDYQIAFTNPAFRKNFGGKTEGRKCFDFLHDRQSPCPWCMNKEVFSGKTVRWECRFPKIQKTFDIIESLIETPDSGSLKMEILRDITEKKKIEESKDEFISLASHQLRTPLSSISLSSELLLRGTSGKIEGEQKEFLEEIHKSAKKMSLLVNNLLNVSRLEMGNFSVEAEPLDILSVVRNKLKEFSPIISEKKLKLEKNIGKSVTPLSFNANSFDIVFDNLLSNAIRYTPEGGCLSVSLKKKGGDIVLEVSDAGCGIPKEARGKIFEKSFRAPNAEKISSEGAGLGLYMVKSIADLTGSKIRFESAPEKGTTFYFSIPIGNVK